MGEKMQAPESGATVRMYNPGFGDCFLLAFRKSDGEPYYMLIDCGVHSQYKGGSPQIREVVKDIRDATGGHLDLVVVTHEHADHVSGFHKARATFQDEISVDEIWLGWTEDPSSPVAKRLDKKKKFMMQALQNAEQRLAANDNGDQAAHIRYMLGFFEMGDDALGVSTRDARDLIRDHAKRARYLKPKRTPRRLRDVDDVRIFVLGPPEDEKLLLAAAPTGAEGEVYESAGGHMRLGGEESFAAALGALESWASEASHPFASNHRVSYEAVRAIAPRFDPGRPLSAQRTAGIADFYRRLYGFDENDPQRWRRIDAWLDPAESLALKLDAATNNTSLVLAIELMQGRRVLLFPGDAQVGNWKSWHEGGWSSSNGLEAGEKVSAEDLLNRTVLYKVGHHGSHNATLREKGLEMMTSDELMAMIPVDENWARARRPHPWKMPFDPMYRDLQQRTRGRILRTDVGLAEATENNRDDSARRRFEAKTSVTMREIEGETKVFYTEVQIPD